MSNWHLEDKHTGRGRTFCGSFDEAIAEASAECTTDRERFVVWQQPGNVRRLVVCSDWSAEQISEYGYLRLSLE
jgi:hypothetical protein